MKKIPGEHLKNKYSRLMMNSLTLFLLSQVANLSVPVVLETTGFQ